MIYGGSKNQSDVIIIRVFEIRFEGESRVSKILAHVVETY
jgi:hypothetical protein